MSLDLTLHVARWGFSRSPSYIGVDLSLPIPASRRTLEQIESAAADWPVLDVPLFEEVGGERILVTAWPGPRRQAASHQKEYEHAMAEVFLSTDAYGKPMRYTSVANFLVVAAKVRREADALHAAAAYLAVVAEPDGAVVLYWH